MLQFSERIRRVPLSVEKQGGKWILFTQDGTKRAVINVEEPALDRWSELLPDPQETLDITLYPDGKREIRLISRLPAMTDCPLPSANGRAKRNVPPFLSRAGRMNALQEPESVSSKWT